MNKCIFLNRYSYTAYSPTCDWNISLHSKLEDSFCECPSKVEKVGLDETQLCHVDCEENAFVWDFQMDGYWNKGKREVIGWSVGLGTSFVILVMLFFVIRCCDP